MDTVTSIMPPTLPAASETSPQRANLTRGGGEPIESPNRDLPAAFSLSESSSPLAFPPESEVASVAGRTPTAGHHDPSSTPGLSPDSPTRTRATAEQPLQGPRPSQL